MNENETLRKLVEIEKMLWLNEFQKLLKKDIEVIEDKLMSAGAWIELLLEQERSERKKFYLEQLRKDILTAIELIRKYYI